nr:MAG TPA: hypothetical protein [Bacteriophage sp.]
MWGGGDRYITGQNIPLKTNYFPHNNNLPLFEWDDCLLNKTIRIQYGTGGDTKQHDLTLSSFPITTYTGYRPDGPLGYTFDDIMQFNLTNNFVYLIQRAWTGYSDVDYEQTEEVHIGVYKVTLLN